MQTNHTKYCQSAFNEYDKLVDEHTDYQVQRIEALQQGDKHLATYIHKNILPALNKKLYQLWFTRQKLHEQCEQRNTS